MKLSKAHMDTFSEAAVQDFEDRMVVHLDKFFPKHVEALGEDGVRKLVRTGIERAASYEITSERGVCKYIDLMVSFGEKFDKDRKLPWAGEILNDESIASPAVRIDRLFKAAKKHVRLAADAEQETEGHQR